MKIIPQLSILALSLHSLYAFSAVGGVGDGGGTRIESAFRVRAYELIAFVRATSQANALCSADSMQRGLEASTIRVVNTLRDLNTNRRITERSLDAWTRPGDIQLLQNAWSQYMREGNVLDRNVDALILHEIYRTTSGQSICIDNNGQISAQVTYMLSHPPAPVAANPQPPSVFPIRAGDEVVVYSGRGGDPFVNTVSRVDADRGLVYYFNGVNISEFWVGVGSVSLVTYENEVNGIRLNQEVAYRGRTGCLNVQGFDRQNNRIVVSYAHNGSLKFAVRFHEVEAIFTRGKYRIGTSWTDHVPSETHPGTIWHNEYSIKGYTADNKVVVLNDSGGCNIDSIESVERRMADSRRQRRTAPQ